MTMFSNSYLSAVMKIAELKHQKKVTLLQVYAFLKQNEMIIRTKEVNAKSAELLADLVVKSI